MLTIAKLGHGRVDYYLDTVANGIEDYYAGTGEAPGTWRGAAAARLGLDGEVDGDVLRAILGGQLPGVYGALAGGGQRRTPGWDLTFSAPKSVSVLFGLADPDVSRQVAAAHEAAVNESVTYLERWALTSRRRQGGAVVTEAGRGMIVAGFRHRTSRAGDPQLHTHALMANAVQRGDGSWGAVDSRVVYRQARSAGFVYQAVLRSQLAQRLGVRWEPVDDRGIAELADVPVAARILFSKRRHQIEAALEARGLSSARAAQVAAVRTRAAKGEIAGTDVLRARWRAEAAEIGVSGGEVYRAVGRLRAGDVLERVSVRQRRHINDELLGLGGLTGQRTSFQRGEISQAWCQAIDPRTVGVTAATVDTLVETTIGDRRSVLLGADDPVRGLDRRRWSSEDLLAVEARILDRVTAGRDRGVATVAASAVRRAVARSTLSDEQQAMVKALTRDGHHVDAVVGVAGSGKTYALSVAHRLWADAGYEVLGAAISKQAATQLQADTGITSGTLDSLLLHLDRPAAHLPAGTVVVVDEAGMVPTRKLDELLGHCAPGVKVVLVGDHRQLPEIDAGGMLRSIAERHPVVTLHDNRRQHDPDERLALADLRDGDVKAGLDWYVAAGRVTSFDDAATAHAAMIETWWADRSEILGTLLLMAERRVDVERLNQLARHRRADAGELDLDHVVIAGGRDFAVGDTVIFERNHRLMGVANAQRGTITALDRAAGGVTVDIGAGRLVDVEHDYLDAGRLNWGYAATVHKNQGATCDAAYLLASDRTYRELGYVALSRGRVSNRICTVSDPERTPTDNPAHGDNTHPEPDPLVDLRRAMQLSAAHQLATDQADELEPVGVDL